VNNFLKLLLALCATCLSFALTQKSIAADASYESDESDWEYVIAPYGWLPGIYGDTQALGAANSVSLSLSPGDFAEVLLENLDFAVIGAVEARRDEYGVLLDVVHLQLSAGKATPRGFVTAGLDLNQTMLTAMGSFRVLETETGHVDLLAGGRLWHVDVELDFDIGRVTAVTRSDGDTWVDPMIGFKGKHELDGQWSVSGWAMVGTGMSDISWDVYAALNYKVRDGFTLLAGWRAAGVDYQSGGFVFDLDFSGPLLGAVWRF